MKKITYILITILIVYSQLIVGQTTISNQVIGSTGSYQVGPNMTLSSTVGEAVVQTLFSTSMILTQGFQQPQSFTDSLLTYEMINESCKGAKNGSIFVNNVLGCPGPYLVIITAIDDSLTILEANELTAGVYDVKIIGISTCTYPTQLTVGLDSDEDCLLKFYSGITPNNDGKNDVWIIENIELYPENTIQIYNRWGNEVWSVKNYNNDTVVWDGSDNSGVELSSSTYFYVAEVGGKIYKGWVEITR